MSKPNAFELDRMEAVNATIKENNIDKDMIQSFEEMIRGFTESPVIYELQKIEEELVAVKYYESQIENIKNSSENLSFTQKVDVLKNNARAQCCRIIMNYWINIYALRIFEDEEKNES